jgi:signal transduction histidine kinase
MRSHSEAAGKSGARDSARRSGAAFWVPLGVTVLTLAIFSAAILVMSAQVRKQLHAGILREDGEVLLAALNSADNQGTPEDSAQDRMTRVLEATEFRKKEVWGVRLFDQAGKFLLAVPLNLPRKDLSAEEVEKLRTGEVFGEFDPAMDLEEQLGPETPFIEPVVISTVPLDVGSAQYLLRGERVGAKLALVDKNIRRYAILWGVIGSVVIGTALTWAFSSLNRSNALLAERTQHLLRANHELSLAAKTSAVGAVAAHLIHGLKNPLTGLQLLVSNQLDEPNGGGREWKIAADAARRMQNMIADIVRIMQEDAGDHYEVSVPEMLDLLQTKVAAFAREKNVQVSAVAKFKGKLANREANLVILALTNLIQNAIQASQPGKRVIVSADLISAAICFDVADEAGGIPEEVRPYLFTPCQSTKPGGTGIGLAITKQMASHMGGKLEVVQTGAEGTIFRLSIPQELFQEENAAKGQLAESTA